MYYLLQTKMGLNLQETGLEISLFDCEIMWLQELSISDSYVKGKWDVSIISFHKTFRRLLKRDMIWRKSFKKKV